MATVIHGTTGRSVYHKVVDAVLRYGGQRSPRGQLTRDLGFTIIELDAPYNALPLACGRKLNVNIAAAEAIQLIGGFSDPELLTRAAPGRFEPYMDDGKFHGAYGDRIKTQMLGVTRKLSMDGNTRQAVATLWDGWLDNLDGRHDYPCTVALQFELREGRYLDMTTIMRSNDVWLGLPYDMFQFTQLQMTLARVLGASHGIYRHVACSMHLYEQHVEKARLITEPQRYVEQPWGIGPMCYQGLGYADIMKRARNLTSSVVNDSESKSEEWYRERFASYMGQDVDERRDGRRGEVNL